MTTSTVRDKLWLWGHESGSHDDGANIPGSSRIPPAEAAYYLNIPNLIMVRYRDYDAPGIVLLPQPPYDQYALALSPLKQLVWSFVNEAGVTDDQEVDRVIDLAGKFPNITGAMMDDFFLENPTDGNIGVHTLDQLSAIKQRLTLPDRRLDLWVVVYAHNFDMPVADHLAACDVVSFWTWKAKHLADLEANFARAEQITPNNRKVLGCYLWDYGDKKPMPLDLMQAQCRIGLDWLKQGRIDGMIFLASCICDHRLDTVEWTKQWIADVGDEPLAP